MSLCPGLFLRATGGIIFPCTDKFSRSLMALTGVTHSRKLPPSRLLAILPLMLHSTHTTEGVAAVIRSQAPNTQVKVIPHHPVWMPVAESARMSINRGMKSKMQTTVCGLK
ncbi:type VI secretion system baseplate subunit TssG [Escherichia coli]|uniref:type VI secretion system baseplate subunit TssG n=1 Tax=Escherichia coli TaxID=562 RepID=UPI0013283AC2|nr:type VI secretion system baseplate subunit TssG [Escherichia coli]MXE64720.1 type VI secretion system baseplate subunit TssG [Escherichia coli]